MLEKLVLATAITFALNIFIGISSSSAVLKTQSQSLDTPFQTTSLGDRSWLQKRPQ